MAEFHVYSQTVADGTATSVVRPSDWNSAHQHIVTLSGNTSNASTISGTNIVFQGGNNVTLSGTQAAGAATIVISAPTQSAQTQSNVQGISAGTQVGRTGDIVFANSNGITFGMSGSNQVTASHNGLTTAAQSNHSHGNPTLALTNLSGTTASNSAGLTLSLSAAAPGAAAEQNAINLLGANTAGNTTATGSTIGWSGVNVTLSGTNDSRVVISAPATSSLAAGANITISTAGNTISIIGAAGGGGAGVDRFFKEVIQGERLTTIVGMTASNVTNRPMLLPFWMEGTGLVPATGRVLMSFGASSNRSLVGTMHMGLYSLSNSTQMTLLTSNSWSISSTNSASSASWNGIGWVDFTGMNGFTCTAEGRYMLAFMNNPGSAQTNSWPVTLYGADNMPQASRIWSNAATSAMNNTHQFVPFWGLYSTTTNAMPASIALSQVNGGSSQSNFQYYAALKEI